MFRQMTKEKESGIEKLIDLLNEYGEYDLVEHNGEICKWTTDDEGEINIYTDYTNNIISKKYGFIKWLVENEKIDLGEMPYLGEYGMGTDFPIDSIIMLLSKQDEPINFLLEILK